MNTSKTAKLWIVLGSLFAMMITSVSARADQGEVTDLLVDIISVTQSLEDSVTPQEIVLLRSIEGQARNALAKVNGYGLSSVTALQNCQLLIKKIRVYNRWIEKGYSVRNTAESIQQLDTDLYALEKALF